MDNSELFQIGEVARLFHISVGTVRHYERLGLLSPEYIDPVTGYRYYGALQFEALNTIRYLRVLDMPLEEIRDFLRNKDVDVIEQKLQKQREAVIQKQQELNLIERKIDHRLHSLHEASRFQLDTIQTEIFPACRIAWMKDTVKPQSHLDLENPIRRLEEGQKTPVVFLGKVGVGISKEKLEAERLDCYDHVFVLLDEEDDYAGNVDFFPEVSCVTIRFCGSHADAPSRYERLLSYIQAHRLHIASFSREITMIDYGLTDDPSKFVTEIRIPVEEG